MKNSVPIIAVVIAVLLGLIYFFVLRPEMVEEDVNGELPQEEVNDEQPQEVEMEEPMSNIVETAIDTPSLSTLVAAVQAAELVEALSDEDAEFTVFAPTNDAFAAIQDTVDTLLLPENQEDLQNVLQYHVVPFEVTSADLVDGMEVTALNGDTLVISITDGVVMVNGAEVVIADVMTSNGVVHVIDAVLVP